MNERNPTRDQKGKQPPTPADEVGTTPENATVPEENDDADNARDRMDVPAEEADEDDDPIPR